MPVLHKAEPTHRELAHLYVEIQLLQMLFAIVAPADAIKTAMDYSFKKILVTTWENAFYCNIKIQHKIRRHVIMWLTTSGGSNSQ